VDSVDCLIYVLTVLHMLTVLCMDSADCLVCCRVSHAGTVVLVDDIASDHVTVLYVS